MNYDNESGIISVSRLNYIVNHSLSINFPLLKVEGEVSQLLVSKLGHAYFTLKDKESCIRCVFFRAELKGSTSIPVNGDLIVVTASPAIYSILSGIVIITPNPISIQPNSIFPNRESFTINDNPPSILGTPTTAGLLDGIKNKATDDNNETKPITKKRKL